MNRSPRSHPNNQVMAASQFPGKLIIEDIVSSHGSIRADLMRNEETVKAVREENILLAEKVQQATNLYRQLLGRVSKTEERLELDAKQLSNVVSQAKNVELTIVGQQEQLVSRENQLVMHVQKLQEEVALLTTEREQSRKMIHNLNHEVRQLHDKVSRQSAAIGTGLQELKAHLDQRDVDQSQGFQRSFNDIRERVEGQDHARSMFQANLEGRIEIINAQLRQIEKQRQDDLHAFNTAIREKEALAKADTRRLAEKLKGLFEEFGQNIAQRDVKIRQDLESKHGDLDRRLQTEGEELRNRFRSLEEDANQHLKDMKEAISEELDTLRELLLDEKKRDVDGITEVAKNIKLVEKKVDQNQKDIEKVLRAEITSRLAQGDRLNTELQEFRKEEKQDQTICLQTIADNKRRTEQAIESARKDLSRAINESLKLLPKSANDEKKIQDIEQKITEIEDALDVFSKLDEHVDLMKERMKQIEMENILAQGDIQTAIDNNNKRLEKAEEMFRCAMEELELISKKKPRPPTGLSKLEQKFKELKAEKESLPSQVHLLEKKMILMQESFEEVKVMLERPTSSNDRPPSRTERKNSPTQGRAGYFSPISLRPVNARLHEIDARVEILEGSVRLLKEAIYSEANENSEDEELQQLMIKLKALEDEIHSNETRRSSQPSPENSDGESDHAGVRKISRDESAQTRDDSEAENNSDSDDARKSASDEEPEILKKHAKSGTSDVPNDDSDYGNQINNEITLAMNSSASVNSDRNDTPLETTDDESGTSHFNKSTQTAQRVRRGRSTAENKLDSTRNSSNERSDDSAPASSRNLEIPDSSRSDAQYSLARQRRRDSSKRRRQKGSAVQDPLDAFLQMTMQDLR